MQPKISVDTREKKVNMGTDEYKSSEECKRSFDKESAAEG